MSVSIARDLMVLIGLGAAVAGTWLIAGLGVALIVLGVVLAVAGATAEMRAGDS
jgi:type IV secretory pathway TrbD component